MERASYLYAHARNALLSYIALKPQVGARLPSQIDLAQICHVSLTTAHRLIRRLVQEGILSQKKGRVFLKRIPRKSDFLPEPQVLSRRDEVEKSLVEMIITGKFQAGQSISELALARQHGVTTSTIREALLSLARLGVFTKQARRQWRMIKVDTAIVNELMDLRTVMESFALQRFLQQPAPAVTARFQRIHREMLAEAQNKNLNVAQFVQLDHEFHQTILAGAGNRYLDDYSRHVSFPIQIQFLQHAFDPPLLRRGMSDHLRILRAINARQTDVALKRLTEHLDHARETLLKIAQRPL